jgi:hypothetical protein
VRVAEYWSPRRLKTKRGAAAHPTGRTTTSPSILWVVRNPIGVAQMHVNDSAQAALGRSFFGPGLHK